VDKPAILTIIKGLAPVYTLPWELVAAIVHTESAFNQWAVRYEPSYKYLVGQEGNLSASERMQQMTSWGLMQVMGGVAREYGHTGFCAQLCDPIVGLNIGCKHLAKYRTRYPEWQDVIASYNAGRPVKRDGKYLNQGYVDKVLARWHAFESPIPLKESEV
jgi:soluble lytic murein transglycosylase-like protein